jgi:hypothetical protein
MKLKELVLFKTITRHKNKMNYKVKSSCRSITFQNTYQLIEITMKRFHLESKIDLEQRKLLVVVDPLATRLGSQ